MHTAFTESVDKMRPALKERERSRMDVTVQTENNGPVHRLRSNPSLGTYQHKHGRGIESAQGESHGYPMTKSGPRAHSRRVQSPRLYCKRAQDDQFDEVAHSKLHDSSIS